ncbi:MAG: peptidylprolyl isomerase [Bryobacterales bacterium]|nr:peptidylprolyl isomerase [Bryobacterales bacterium]
MERVTCGAACGLLLMVASVFAQDAPPAPVAPSADVVVPSTDAVVLTVGELRFTRAEFENLIQALPAQLQQAARGPQKREFAMQLAELFAVAGEAEKRNMASRPELAMRLKYQRDNLLAGFLYQEMVEQAVVSDEAVAEFYEKNKDSFEEVTARHILVRFTGSRVPQKEGKAELSEEEAQAKVGALKAKIAEGAAFADVAKEESDDTGSAQTGGSLGTFGRGQMIPEFENAAFTQELGIVGDPVRTDFGYHLILVDDRKSKTIADVRDEIEQQLKPQVARAQLKALAEKMNVVLDENYFAATAPATPTLELDPK